MLDCGWCSGFEVNGAKCRLINQTVQTETEPDGRKDYVHYFGLRSF